MKWELECFTNNALSVHDCNLWQALDITVCTGELPFLGLDVSILPQASLSRISPCLQVHHNCYSNIRLNLQGEESDSIQYRCHCRLHDYVLAIKIILSIHTRGLCVNALGTYHFFTRRERLFVGLAQNFLGNLRGE